MLVALVVASLLVWVRPANGWSRTTTTTTSPTSLPPSAPTGAPGGPARHVLGLGDSVVSGANCDCPDYIEGLTRLLAARDHRAVAATDDAVSGATSSDLLEALRTDASIRADVRSADVVVVTVGANDLYPSLDQWRQGGCGPDCYQPDIAVMADRVRQIVDAVSALQNHSGAILVTNYWNVFTDGDVAREAETDGYLDWSDAVTRAANSAICRSAAADQVRCVDLYTAFKGDGDSNPTPLLADDGDHPNPAGTALISRAVLAALHS